MFGTRKDQASRIDTLIGRATRVEGDLTFTGGLHLDGRVTGSVTAEGEASSMLSVSESGVIEGSVVATQVVLNGAVKGDITARERVVFGAQAKVEGNVRYGVIEIADGATIQGRLICVASAARKP
ncbi:MAG: polymer-forming cytoskeletal protein [Steroidobacteraceae bacterium]